MILVTEDVNKPRYYTAVGQFYLPQAYLRREKKTEPAKALEVYKTAERLAPKFAPTYMRLGIHYMKTGNKPVARRYFEQYLALAPKDATDRGYVQQYMNSL